MSIHFDSLLRLFTINAGRNSGELFVLPAIISSARMLIALSPRHVDYINYLPGSQLLASPSSFRASNIAAILSIAVGFWFRRMVRCLHQSQGVCETAYLGRKSEPDNGCWVRVYWMQRCMQLTVDRWLAERCVGQNGAIPRLGFRSLCLQDSPLGIRFSKCIAAGIDRSI